MGKVDLTVLNQDFSDEEPDESVQIKEDDIREAEAILKSIEEIEADPELHPKDRYLWCVVRLIFQCGVKRKEIPEFEIRHIVDRNGEIRDKALSPISLDDIPLEKDVKESLMAYLQGILKMNPQKWPKCKKVFPNLPNEKQVARVLEKKGLWVRDLHELGLKYSYYKAHSVSGLQDNKALKETAKKFRMTPRSAYQSLTGTIQKAGKPRPTLRDELMSTYERFNSASRQIPPDISAMENAYGEFLKMESRIRPNGERKFFETYKKKMKEDLTKVLSNLSKPNQEAAEKEELEPDFLDEYFRGNE